MKKKKNNVYFTEETENAIVLYNTTKDPDKKAKIFSDHIYYPFYKLAENIIHSYKFYYTDFDDIEDLKHKIITVLLEEKIHKFDPTYGAKAYSYFGTIVKRWLINFNNSNYKKLKKRGTLDEYVEESFDLEIDEKESMFLLSDLIDQFIQDIYDNMDVYFNKDQDKHIADCVLTLFKTRQDLQIFKKKALYIYIREMTDCKTSHLTKVVKILKDRFHEIYIDKVNKGYKVV